MKQYLFDLLPAWLHNYKHADKIAHAIGGVFIYICLSFLLPNHWALFVTWGIALAVEIYDGQTHKPDVIDFLATIILPTIIYIFKP